MEEARPKGYTVHLEAFEGPMDLLMHLIEKEKIDIYDIPIAKLTEQYLDYLRQMQEFDMEIASSFLVMAATLLQIKSRMMLPKPPAPQEEEEEDPRLELVRRILEYRKFKQVSSVLEGMAGTHEKQRTAADTDQPVIPQDQCLGSKRISPGGHPAEVLIGPFRTGLPAFCHTPCKISSIIIGKGSIVKVFL